MINLSNDDYNACGFNFEQKDSNNHFRLIRLNDNSIRIMQYDENGVVENGNVLQINSNNGMILGSNSLGFFGKIPVSKATLKANATDLNSAIELVNDIKSNLIRLGLLD